MPPPLQRAKPAGAEPALVTPSSYGAAGSPEPPPEKRGAAGGALSKTVSHHARRLADRFGLDLSGVKGTGPDGLILREDVDAAMAAGTLKPAGRQRRRQDATAPPSPIRRSPRKRKSASSRARPRRWPATWTRARRSRRRRRSARSSVGTLEARRAELNAALKTAGPRREDLVHPPHRLRARASRERTAGDVRVVPARRTANRSASKPASTSASPSTRSAKTVRASLVVPVIKSAAALDFAAFRAAYEELVAKARDNKLTRRRTDRRDVHADESGRHRHRRLGAASDGRPRRDRRRRRDRVSRPASRTRPTRRSSRSAIEKVMTMTSTYDHRIIQGAAVGRIPQAHRRTAQRRRRLLRERLRRLRSACGACAATPSTPMPARSRLPGRAGACRRVGRTRGHAVG